MRWYLTMVVAACLALAGASEVQVAETRGAAMLLPAHGDRWQLAQVGQGLLPGDRLRVPASPGQHARLSLPQAGHLQLGPGSVIEVHAEGGLILRQGQLGLYQAQDLPIRLGADAQPLRWNGSLVLDAEDGALAADAVPDWVRGLAMADARQSGLALLGSEGDGSRHAVQPAEVDMEVRIVDGLAHCSLEVGFRQHVRGLFDFELQLPLPAQAAVDGFALYQSWSGWQQASVVERQRGRAIWQELLEERIDPAMLEWEAGSIFRMRVFPVSNSTRMRVQWIEPLSDDGNGGASWHLALGDLIPSDAGLERLRIRVLLPGAQTAEVYGGAFDPRMSQVDAGMEILDTAQQLRHPIADWQLRVEQSPQLLREDNDKTVVLRQRAEPAPLPSDLQLEPLRLLVAVDRSAQGIHAEALYDSVIEALCDLLPAGSEVRLAAAHLELEILDEDWWDPKDLLTRHGMLYQLQQTLPLGAANHPASWSGAAALEADAVLYLGSGQDSFHSQGLVAHDYAGRWLALGLGPRVNAAGLAQWGRDGAQRAAGPQDLGQALARIEALLAGADLQPLLPELPGIAPERWLPAEDGAGNPLWYVRLPGDHPSLKALEDLPRAQGQGLLSRAQLQAEVVQLSRQQLDAEGRARLRYLGDSHGLLTPLHALLVLDSDAMRERFGIEEVLPASDGSGLRDVAAGELLDALRKDAHIQALDAVASLRHAARVHLGLGMRQVWPPSGQDSERYGSRAAGGFDLYAGDSSDYELGDQRLPPLDPALAGDADDAADDAPAADLEQLLGSTKDVHPQEAFAELAWQWQHLLGAQALRQRPQWSMEPDLWNDLAEAMPNVFDTTSVPQQRLSQALVRGTLSGREAPPQWRVRYQRMSEADEEDDDNSIELMVDGDDWLLRWQDHGRNFLRWQQQHSAGALDADAGITDHWLPGLHGAELPMLPGATAPTITALLTGNAFGEVITIDPSDAGDAGDKVWHLRRWRGHYLNYEAWFSQSPDGAWHCQRERLHLRDGRHLDTRWTWEETALGQLPVAISQGEERWQLRWDIPRDGSIAGELQQALAGTLSLPGAQSQPDAGPRVAADLLWALAESSGEERAQLLSQITNQAPRLHPLLQEGWLQSTKGDAAFDSWLSEQAAQADSSLARELIRRWRWQRGYRPESRRRQRDDAAITAWPDPQGLLRRQEWQEAIQAHRRTYGPRGAIDRLITLLPPGARGEEIIDIAISQLGEAGSAADQAAIRHLLHWVLSDEHILIQRNWLPYLADEAELMTLLRQRLQARGHLGWRQGGRFGQYSRWRSPIRPWFQHLLNQDGDHLTMSWLEGSRLGDPAAIAAIFTQRPELLERSSQPASSPQALMDFVPLVTLAQVTDDLDEPEQQRVWDWLRRLDHPLPHLAKGPGRHSWGHDDLQRLMDSSSRLQLQYLNGLSQRQRDEQLVALWQGWAALLPEHLAPYLQLAAAEIQGRRDPAAAVASIRPLAQSQDPALAVTALYSWAAVAAEDEELMQLVQERSREAAGWHARHLRLLLALAHGQTPEQLLTQLHDPQIEGPVWSSIIAMLQAASGDWESALHTMSLPQVDNVMAIAELRLRLLQALDRPFDRSTWDQGVRTGTSSFSSTTLDLDAHTLSPGWQSARLVSALAEGELIAALELLRSIDNHRPLDEWQQALISYGNRVYAADSRGSYWGQHPAQRLQRAFARVAETPFGAELVQQWQSIDAVQLELRARTWMGLTFDPPSDPLAVFTFLRQVVHLGEEDSMNWLRLPDPAGDAGPPPEEFLAQEDALKTWSIRHAPESWLAPVLVSWLQDEGDAQQRQALLDALEQRSADPQGAAWAMPHLKLLSGSDIGALRLRLDALIRLPQALQQDDPAAAVLELLPQIGSAPEYAAPGFLRQHLKDLESGAWQGYPAAEALALAVQEHLAEHIWLQIDLWWACGAFDAIVRHHLQQTRSNKVGRAWTHAAPEVRRSAAQQLAEGFWQEALKSHSWGSRGGFDSGRHRAAQSLVAEHFTRLGLEHLPTLSNHQRLKLLDYIQSDSILHQGSLEGALLSALASDQGLVEDRWRWRWLTRLVENDPKQATAWYEAHTSWYPAADIPLQHLLILMASWLEQDQLAPADALWQEWCQAVAQGQAITFTSSGFGGSLAEFDAAHVLQNPDWRQGLLAAIAQRLDQLRDQAPAHDPWNGHEYEPSHGSPWHLWPTLAALAQAGGDAPLALRALSHIDHPHALEWTARHLPRRGDPRQLLAAMDAQHVAFPSLRASLALRLLEMGEQQRAEATLAAAIARWPQHPELRSTLLELLISSQGQDQAPELQRWRPLILFPDSVGENARQDLLSQAIDSWESSTLMRLISHPLGLNPQQPEALLTLAEHLRWGGDHAAPKRQLGLLAAEQAHQADPDNAAVILIWAQLLSDGEAYQQAQELLGPAIKRQDWRGESSEVNDIIEQLERLYHYVSSKP